MSEETLRRELYESYENRARIYHMIFDELRGELGAERAEAVLKRAIYRRGIEIGAAKFARFAPRRPGGPEGGVSRRHSRPGPHVSARGLARRRRLARHQVSCLPAAQAWQESGLPDAEVAALCRIAARIDNGTFEGAGFRFSADTWQPGGEGCCLLHIRRGEASSGTKS